MQLDSARGSAITSGEVYHWQTDVLGGIQEMNTKKTQARSYFAGIERKYGAQALSDLPQTFTPPGTNTTLTALEVAILTLYNGGSLVEILLNVYGNPQPMASCWRFNPSNPMGSRWEFVPNRNYYVYKVIRDEYEGNH